MSARPGFAPTGSAAVLLREGVGCFCLEGDGSRFSFELRLAVDDALAVYRYRSGLAGGGGRPAAGGRELPKRI